MTDLTLCPHAEGLAPGAGCTLPAGHDGEHDIAAFDTDPDDVCDARSTDGALDCDLHHDHSGPHATGHQEWDR